MTFFSIENRSQYIDYTCKIVKWNILNFFIFSSVQCNKYLFSGNKFVEQDFVADEHHWITSSSLALSHCPSAVLLGDFILTEGRWEVSNFHFIHINLVLQTIFSIYLWCIDYYRLEICKFLYPQIRNGEIYIYLEFSIVNNVLFRGREWVFTLSMMLI